jgi:capsid protein
MTVLDTLERVRKRQAPVPLRREAATGNSFVRYCAAHAIAFHKRILVRHVCEEMWPQDRALELLITRAASGPAMYDQTGWATELARKVIIDEFDALAGASAGAALGRQCLQLAFDRNAYIGVPGIVADATHAAFVADGAPIPVVAFNLFPVTLKLHKVASIVALTRQMIESSNIEALMQDALTRSTGMAIDAALFDANAASATRSAGLRYNLAPIAASTATDQWQAAIDDLASLVKAVSPIAGNGPLVFVTSPHRRLRMALRWVDALIPDITVLASSALNNEVLCIVPAALAIGIGPPPEIDTANAAALHMEDTSPQPPPASPLKSMYQSDSIAVKIRTVFDWGLRDSRAVAWLTATTW